MKPYHSSPAIEFWLLTFAYFLSYFFRSTNAVIAPDLTRELNLSAGDLGLMTSLFYFAFAASQIPIGLGLDRFGARVVQPVLLGIAVLGSVLFGLAQSFFMLALARMLLGVGLAKENLFPSYEITGVSNPDQLQADLATQCREMFNRPIRPQISVEVAGDKRVIVAFIPEAQPNEKPIFIQSRGLPKGAFRRIGSTDQVCTEDDIRSEERRVGKEC